MLKLIKSSSTLTEARQQANTRNRVLINTLFAAAPHLAERRIKVCVCPRSNFNTAQLTRSAGRPLKWKRKQCQAKGLRSNGDKAKGPAPTPELASAEPTKTPFYLNIKNIGNGKEISLTHASRIASRGRAGQCKCTKVFISWSKNSNTHPASVLRLRRDEKSKQAERRERGAAPN